MSMRHYPSRRTPFVEQKSPRGRRGRGLGIGAIVFLVILLGLFYVILVVIPPIIEDMVLPDIGIPYATLFLLVLGVFMLVIIYVGVRGGMASSSQGSYKDRDPSICTRVIRDGFDGAEFIISGDRQETFAQACIKNWQFESVSQKSSWFIKDEKGNDVSDRYLETVDGIFILVPEYGSESSKEEPDASDEYSSIQDSVTYYD